MDGDRDFMKNWIYVFSLRLIFTDSGVEKISIRNLGDYNCGTKTLPQYPNPKCNQRTLNYKYKD